MTIRRIRLHVGGGESVRLVNDGEVPVVTAAEEM